MTHEKHLEELQSVLLTMIRISKYTVYKTGVLPPNILDTITGLREYVAAVEKNQGFVEDALKNEGTRGFLLFGIALASVKLWVTSWFD